ncbi:bactofilin [Paenibacillus timonensis]|uniref:Bactofilin n=1 Tax=Paenibacillus timonensis TaxID=225915 RepID=A0ABW3SBD9_9BACL|nr:MULTISPECIES: bactofilin [Paenibacillus]MCH1640464.1 bactofilin [Paenibacillus timonensis]MDU2240360.1 bactofilin [Paenibacillus sp.]
MAERSTKDLKINGVGQASGGAYRKIQTEGIATLNGDIACEALGANGTLKIKGTIDAGEFRLNGTGSSDGALQGGRFELDGMFKVSGNVRFSSLHVRGILKSGGSVTGEIAKVDGALKLEGSAEFEEAEIYGQLRVGGMLNAGKLTIDLEGPSHAKEIGGEHIVVRQRKAKRLLDYLSPIRVSRLTAGVIEGDDVLLESTKADVVRGKSVVIGPGCEIGRVEYKERYEVSPQASVGRAEQK